MIKMNCDNCTGELDYVVDTKLLICTSCVRECITDDDVLNLITRVKNKTGYKIINKDIDIEE